MKHVFTVTAFLGGALMVAGYSALAQSKAPTETSQKWELGVVDEGSIRSNMVLKLGSSRIFETKTDEFIKERDEATDTESKKQIDAFLTEGYEPYTSAVYRDEHYANEKVWFFRKKTQ